MTLMHEVCSLVVLADNWICNDKIFNSSKTIRTNKIITKRLQQSKKAKKHFKFTRRCNYKCFRSIIAILKRIRVKNSICL